MYRSSYNICETHKNLVSTWIQRNLAPMIHKYDPDWTPEKVLGDDPYLKSQYSGTNSEMIRNRMIADLDLAFSISQIDDLMTMSGYEVIDTLKNSPIYTKIWNCFIRTPKVANQNVFLKWIYKNYKLKNLDQNSEDPYVKFILAVFRERMHETSKPWLCDFPTLCEYEILAKYAEDLDKWEGTNFYLEGFNLVWNDFEHSNECKNLVKSLNNK